jgi:hypothetical protein
LFLKNGSVHACGSPDEVFVDEEYLAQAGLSLTKSEGFLQTMSLTNAWS